MRYEILPCTEEESDLIDEKADEIVAEYASADEDDEEEVFIFKVSDSEGSLIGGCILITDELKTATILYLWVDEAYRRQGIASALMRECERKAREQGCYLALLGTFDFQAKPFYDKHGYSVIVTTKDFPKGHEHYFMQKRLDRQSGEIAPSEPCRYNIELAGDEAAEELSERLNRYDEACVPREHPYISISKKAVDENGNVIAGIVGGVDCWNGTEIESIWVDEAFRGQGIGSALVRAFERAAKENGAYWMIVEPYEWNIEFFRKNGYDKITGVLEDHPKGHTMYCMAKPL